jgi:hypothetical protein
MSIDGVSNTTVGSNNAPAASADGVDDVGSVPDLAALTPADLPSNETFGIAFTFKTTSTRNGTHFFGGEGSGGRFTLEDNKFGDSSNGEPFLGLEDSNNGSIFVQTKASFASGNLNLCVINKNGNDASQVNFYINDMSTAKPKRIDGNSGFDHTAYNYSARFNFFAERASGTTQNFREYDSSLFEFNSEPYSQQDRLGLKQRAPGF